jgi:type IV pilus assembly protein PilP
MSEQGAMVENMTQWGWSTRLVCCGGLLLMLAACSNNEEMAALQDEISAVVNRPPGVIEPPPEFVTYEAFDYSAASLRSPFELPIDANALRANQQNSNVRPDENRTPEILENFAIGNLVVVGTLSRGSQRWALIRDETGNITRAGIGNYMGRNHGRIVGIGETQIDVVEIVTTGDGGWIERPQTLTMQE